MITLPKDIQEAVRTSEDQPIRLTDPDTNTEYVLLPAELYDQARELFYEHSTLSPDEKRALIFNCSSTSPRPKDVRLDCGWIQHFNVRT